MSLISQKYALALYSVAKEQDLILQTKELLLKLIQNLSKNQEVEIKSLPKFFANFLLVLIKKKHLALIKTITNDFINIYNFENNIVVGRILSAHKINNTIISKIESIMSKKVGAKVILNNEIDKDILGGFVVYYKDRVLDFSLLKNIEKLRERIIHV